MIRRSIDALRRALASKHVLWGVPALTAALLAFGLDAGWMVDDYVHQAALTRHPDLPTVHRSPGALFAFVDGDPERLSEIVAQGAWPWWSAPELRLAFWRPVSGWSHALDYRLWPDNPRLMHLQSIAWHLLAVVLVLLFLRGVLSHRPAVAGLAGLLFAIDDSQAIPALWLANRNAVLGVAFGAGCLLAHDRWRRGGWHAGVVAGPLLLLAAVLANEGAVAIGGYLLAYALCLDPAPRHRSLAALLPAAGVGLAWTAAYKAGGYGALASGGYIDPATEPLRFAAVAAERAPYLLWGRLGFPPPDLANFLPDAARWQTWALVVGLLALFAWLLCPVLRREATARFLSLGMLVALLPASSTFPSSRLLGFVGIGAAGLVALLIAELASQSAPDPSRGRRWGRRALLAALGWVHLIMAPLFIHPTIGQMKQLDTLIGSSAASLVELAPGPRDGPTGAGEVIVVTAPSGFIALSSGLVATVAHGWHAPKTFVLSASIYDTEITRTGDASLLIRPRGGFLRTTGSPHPAGIENAGAGLDTRRVLLMLDHLFRDLARDPFLVGDRVALDGVTLEIVEEEAGRPLAVACLFADSLENQRRRWLAWRGGRYEPFPLPAVGETVTWPGIYPPSR